MADVARRETQELADRATGYLLERHSVGGRRICWMMIASIFIEAWLVPIAAAAMLWGHYWDAENLVPAFFGSIGPANATFFTAIFPVVGLLAAAFLLPEVYGYVEVRRSRARETLNPASHQSEHEGCVMWVRIDNGN
jgi:hypothetical protein